MHSNKLEGAADHFDNDNISRSFITDCRNAALTERLIAYQTCAVCCNVEKECITEAEFWPMQNLLAVQSTFEMSAVGIVCLIFFIRYLFIIHIAAKTTYAVMCLFR